MESWVPVYGWEGLYEVSNTGIVRSLIRHGKTMLGIRPYGGKILKEITKKRGYLFVNMTNRGIRSQRAIHTLVLESFVGPRPPMMDACHNNGITSDNRLDNLRWDTRSGNHSDKKKHGTSQNGEKNGNHKYTCEQVEDIKNGGINKKEAINKYGISKSQYHRIITGQSWTHLVCGR